METNKETKELVEKIGVFLEKAVNFQPVPARIAGYLLLSEPPYKTFDEIREYLNVSKSAVSQALNLLISQSFIDYITLPGDRKRYFRITANPWMNIIKKDFECMFQFKPLFQEILKQRSDKFPELNKQIESMISFLGVLEKEISLIFKKLKME